MIPSLAKTFIEKLLEEVKKEHNMTKIQINVVNPLLQYCYSRLFPYFLIMTAIFLLTFILALLIFIMLLKQLLFDKNTMLS
jgi:hypothetical protein